MCFQAFICVPSRFRCFIGYEYYIYISNVQTPVGNVTVIPVFSADSPLRITNYTAIKTLPALCASFSSFTFFSLVAFISLVTLIAFFGKNIVLISPVRR